MFSWFTFPSVAPRLPYSSSCAISISLTAQGVGGLARGGEGRALALHADRAGSPSCVKEAWESRRLGQAEKAPTVFFALVDFSIRAPSWAALGGGTMQLRARMGRAKGKKAAGARGQAGGRAQGQLLG